LVLVDKFNRLLELIQVSVIDNCHYNCSHCRSGIENGSADLFASADIIRFVRIMAALGLGKVRLTGGEPFLRPDILDLLTGLGRIRPGLKISLATNGKLLGSMAPDLTLRNLDRIFVSLPTLDRSVFRDITGQDDLESILEGINTASTCHIPLAIKMHLLGGVNDHQIENMVDWAVAAGLDLYLIEDGATFGGATSFTQEQILQRIRKNYSLVRAEGSAIRNKPWRIDEHNSTVKIVTSDSRLNCGACNRLWLSARGVLRLCNEVPLEYDLMALFNENPSDQELVEFAAKIPLNKPIGVNYSERSCQKQSSPPSLRT